ncbi:conserved hypothetical protein [Theileria equi strain WA]|uniref:Serine aminopeptidase S33 domain-containing protein n=1 Tax=Theileria equi strain WA TaxID=1537102 RepID=L1LB79_THEEQ|nr:conserved hypothetical protein [Theileria equi strain WA]EKX72586.1 conserved hypothetical protein [Theileria equi strain WA]|eukprot:XP_004832038.1 conserved hypothetical protein [Theileria equi strain WA]
MKLLATYLFLFSCKLCALVNVENSGERVEEVTLDISAPDPLYVETLKRAFYLINAHFYVAKDATRISSIVDKEQILWKAANGLSCDHVVLIRYPEGNGCHPGHQGVTGLLLVYTGSHENVRMPLYFARNGGAWTETKEEEFYDKFHQMVLQKTVFESIEIDIEKRETCDKYFVTNTSNFPFLVYAPNVGYRISKIFNGITIWEAKGEDERCLYVSLYPRDEPKLAYLIVSSWRGEENIYLHKINYGWARINEDEYMDNLKGTGFDESKFDNKQVLDLENVNSDVVRLKKLKFGDTLVCLHVPLLGFLLEKVVDGQNVLWETSGNEYCIYVNKEYNNDSPRTLFLIVSDNEGNRRLLYFKRNNEKWEATDEDEYFSLHNVNKNVSYTHQGNGKIVMSSFKNKQGLRIATYASRVENAKGDFVLAHGLSSLFMFTFCRKYYEWNCKTFGTPLSPYLGEPFIGRGLQKGSNVEKYGHLFEHAKLEGMDAFEAFPKYKYNNCFVEFLNGLGYNVYGYDLQSHGLSESVSEFRCSMDDFKDYVYDVLQFVSIVKRGKFDDPSETFDERSLYENIPTDKKIFLLGNSMSGNIVMQAVQEFYKNAEKGTKFVDGLVSFSTMIDIYPMSDIEERRKFRERIRRCARDVPTDDYSDYVISNFGQSFSAFAGFNDPLGYNKKPSYKVVELLFNACEGLVEDDNMANYPRDLPTLLLHSKGDLVCGIGGLVDMVDKYKDKTFKLIQLEGKSHGLTIPKSLSTISVYVSEWLDNYT